jgi:hypothetical protein
LQTDTIPKVIRKNSAAISKKIRSFITTLLKHCNGQKGVKKMSQAVKKVSRAINQPIIPNNNTDYCPGNGGGPNST